MARLTANDTLDRQKGSGRPATVRTAEAVAKVKSVFEEKPRSNARDVMRETGLKRWATREIIKKDLGMKPLTQVKAQRVTVDGRKKRLAQCEVWKAEIESGDLDLKSVYGADEKYFRLGATPGGNKKFVVYVKDTLKKREVPNNLILRGDGQWMGGVSVMVSLGLCYKGVGTLRFAPSGTRLNKDEYLEIVRNTYLPDCHQHYGVPPSCVFQQDGATCHTANNVQSYCAEKFPKFWPKSLWPPHSPDLNPLDFFAWGYLQAEVDKQQPKCLDTFKLAIRRVVEILPLEFVQKAALSFYKRVCLCIEGEGGVFKHKTYKGEVPIVQFVAKDEEEISSEEEGGN